MIIQFVNRQSKQSTRIWQTLIRRVFANALPPGVFCEETAVTVTFAGPIVMRRINRETRGVDRLTDVLSFPLIEMEEGCLSVPGRWGDVERPEKVVFKALDRTGKPIKLKAEGLLAVCACHEFDHLNGTLFTDKVTGELIRS